MVLLMESYVWFPSMLSWQVYKEIRTKNLCNSCLECTDMEEHTLKSTWDLQDLLCVFHYTQKAVSCIQITKKICKMFPCIKITPNYCVFWFPSNQHYFLFPPRVLWLKLFIMSYSYYKFLIVFYKTVLLLITDYTNLILTCQYVYFVSNTRH